MTITQLLPGAVKRPLKRWYASQMLTSGLNALRAGHVTDAELAKVRTGWANDGWDAKPVFLTEIIRALQATSGPVLECGSGLSTLVMAAVAPHRLRVSLEHHPAWAERVRQALEEHHLGAEVRDAPLVDHGNGLRWYATDPPPPAGIGLIICDGPDCYGRGRYAVLPVVREYLAPDAMILFDDAAADGQPEVLDAWTAEFGARVERRSSDGVHYALVRVPRTEPQA